jgi:membrane protease YdiL (CAAX protease family)
MDDEHRLSFVISQGFAKGNLLVLNLGLTGSGVLRENGETPIKSHPKDLKLNTYRQFVIRYQLAIFVVLTYLISWAVIGPAQGGLLPQGPMIAAFLLLAVVSGRQGTAGLWHQMSRWRVGWQWYLIAPGFLVVAHLFAFTVSLMLGAEIVNTTQLQPLTTYLNTFILLLFLGGQWEEPGWLGYALRRLQRHFVYMPLTAALIAGLIRMVWHTPLLMADKIPWYDYVFTSFALQFIFTWLYNRTDSSILIPMIGHLFSNLLFATLAPLFGEAEQAQYHILLTIGECVLALGLVILTRGRLGLKDGGNSSSL